MKAEFLLLLVSSLSVPHGRSLHPVIMDINLSEEKTFVFIATIEITSLQTKVTLITSVDNINEKYSNN